MNFKTQTHIPPKLRNTGSYRAIAEVYGKGWERPKFENDLDIREILYGPPRVIRRREDFRPYQEFMVQKILELDSVLIGAEMGLGKTAACLAAFDELLTDKVVRKVLVIAPINVAENTWPEEMGVWDFARKRKHAIVTGDEIQRIASLKEDADFYFINRENVAWLVEFLTSKKKWFFDAIIYDEVSRLKSGRKRTKPTVRKDGTVSERKLSEFGSLTMIRNKVKKFVGLSGTPTPNGIIDLWGPMYMIDRGERLGRSKTKFLQRWFSHNRWTHDWTPHEHSRDDILDKCSDVFFSLKTKDYLKLPPLIARDHLVELPERARKLYETMERDMCLEEFDVEAVNRGVLANKLLQMANGSLYVDEGEAKHLHNAKLDALASIVTEAQGAPILCAYSFQFDIPQILKRFPKARLYEGPKDKRDWDRGKIPLLLTHPASVGHGMNFQHGGNISVWYGLTWSLELYLQFIARLWRSGQEADSVYLHRIVARNTVDFRLLDVLSSKDADMAKVMHAVRANVDVAHALQQVKDETGLHQGQLDKVFADVVRGHRRRADRRQLELL